MDDENGESTKDVTGARRGELQIQTGMRLMGKNRELIPQAK